MTKTSPTFPEIITQLNTLTDDLKRSTSESERRTLLRQFRMLLDNADTILHSGDEMKISKS
jgi:hypothetical protein